ncbi:MAG: hypothetical protein K2X81_10785, partial [Candidatus Obscuribacterales bacterium]|nr:hypothetical protein [Candidatus Obscuribacterales bacterium]
MININKSKEPSYLTARKKTWVKEIRVALKRKTWNQLPRKFKRRYKEDQIKQVLKSDNNDKCAYCEQYISSNQ